MAKWKINEVMKDYEKEIDDALDVVGKFLADEGQSYALGQYGNKLQALDLGNYEKSFLFDRPNKQSVRNGNTADYSIHIEFGTGQKVEEWGINVVKYKNKKGKTITRAGMKPRPILQTVIDSSDLEILDIMGRI